jgi:hypothetical protein
MRGKLIHDEFTAQTISRQRKYQLRRQRDGKCPLCGDPVGRLSTFYCDFHAATQRKRLRVR